MKTLNYKNKGFAKEIQKITDRRDDSNEEIKSIVRQIISEVRKGGNKALFRYTKKFDHCSLSSSTIAISQEEIQKAYISVEKAQVKIIKKAAGRIAAFHKRQLSHSWKYKEKDGTLLGQLVTPMERVGIYVPGGKAAYPSSVLMNAIPAKIAGVKEIVMCSPACEGKISPVVLIAADIAGVDKIYKVGGAQAVASMAYGTQSVPRVDKIVGPGNIYVALAKKEVFGDVAIDMIAGPSEILVIADETAQPDFIAADFLAQAEHDEMAITTLITPSYNIALAVVGELKKQTKELARKEIIEKALQNNCTIIIVSDLVEAARISNEVAPEHLELAVKAPFKLLQSIIHAGSIFLGHYTPESFGDYMAGPNHVLPTGGTARFSSPLGVYDFQKRSSIISFTKKGFSTISDDVAAFASMEGLDAHARAVSIRKKK